jgi:hypothetical protein
MILYLKRVDGDRLEQLKNRLNVSATPEQNHNDTSGIFRSLFRKKETQTDKLVSDRFHVSDFFFEECDEGDLIDFDKAWDALHFMLTGEPWSTEGPLAIMFYQGEEIGSDDGYGPARFIPKEVMSTFSTALKNLSDEDIARRYDPAAMDMAQLYASYIFAEEGDAALEYVMQGVPQLREFAEKCAMTNSGALVGIY